MTRKPVTLIDLMIHLADQDEAVLDAGLDAQNSGATGASSLPHEHTFAAWGSDARFERCSGCGAVRRVDIPGGAAALASINPCVQRWGVGPADKTCGSCAHLRWFRQSKRWYKCELRDDLTHGVKSDQRQRWPACAKFEPAKRGNE